MARGIRFEREEEGSRTRSRRADREESSDSSSGRTEMMGLSKNELVSLGTPKAIAELKRRGRDADGVKFAWKEGRSSRDGTAMPAARERRAPKRADEDAVKSEDVAEFLEERPRPRRKISRKEDVLTKKLYPMWKRLAKGEVLVVTPKGYGFVQHRPDRTWVRAVAGAGMSPADVDAVIWSARSSDALTFFIDSLKPDMRAKFERARSEKQLTDVLAQNWKKLTVRHPLALGRPMEGPGFDSLDKHSMKERTLRGSDSEIRLPKEDSARDRSPRSRQGQGLFVGKPIPARFPGKCKLSGKEYKRGAMIVEMKQRGPRGGKQYALAARSNGLPDMSVSDT